MRSLTILTLLLVSLGVAHAEARLGSMHREVLLGGSDSVVVKLRGRGAGRVAQGIARDMISSGFDVHVRRSMLTLRPSISIHAPSISSENFVGIGQRVAERLEKR